MLITINNAKKIKNIHPDALLGKSPLPHKMQKNNAKTRDRTGRCRQFVNVLRIILHNCGIIFISSHPLLHICSTFVTHL